MKKKLAHVLFTSAMTITAGFSDLAHATDTNSKPVFYSISALPSFAGSSSDEVMAINNSSLATGTSSVGYFGHSFAFQSDAHEIYSLGSLGGSFSKGLSINSLGQIVGFSFNSQNQIRPFYWDSISGMHDLGTLGGGRGTANGINDVGQAVGSSSTANGIQHATLWQNGNVIDLGTLGGNGSEAKAINNQGTAVGWSYIGGFIRGVIWNGNQKIALGTLGGNNSYATAISDKGVVIGYADTSTNGRALAYWTQVNSPNILYPIWPLGPNGVATYAYGVNHCGQIVGTSFDGSSKAFLYNSLTGVMVDLSDTIDRTTGWSGLTNAVAINDSGVIVGQGIYLGQRKMFILTPTPICPYQLVPDTCKSN